MKKGGFLRNVLDTIRSNQTNQPSGSSSSGSHSTRTSEYGGQLKPQHFSLSQVARHGFPEYPTALAFDPVQKIAAIGTKTGAIRVFGRPGVDVCGQHKPEFAVTHIKFIVNQGAIVTVTSDDSIHLWSLRGPNLKLQLSNTMNSANSPSPAQLSPSNLPQASTTTAVSSASSSIIDSGAKPGDPDYLADKLSSSPSSDKSKQFSKQPEVLHTLKFQREHITCLHLAPLSKWLYIGTERGNVHVANVETFELSGYSIAWNKAIELSRKNHPGSIIHISECPQDSNKLLIGYEGGCIVLWDLKNRNADGRYYHTENLLWLAWHYEGKQFVAAHGDGSLVTWQTRSNTRPTQILWPHAKTASQSNSESYQNESSSNQQQSLSVSFACALSNELYRPINKIEWKTSKNNEQFLLFSGGLPCDDCEQQTVRLSSSPSQGSSRPTSSGNELKSPTPALASPSPTSPSISPSAHESSPAGRMLAKQLLVGGARRDKKIRSTSLTVMYGKSITVLEMDETIIDFITVCENSPYENDTSEPLAVIVLLANDLILIDLTSSGYPSFDSPYPASSLNDSPVTCLHYLADCQSDLIPFLYSTSQNVVSRAPKKGFSDKEWPINGGEWGQPMQSYPELVLTGHADGTIKLWDMSGVNFDLISKVKTSKLFERPNKLPNSIIFSYGQQQSNKRAPALKVPAASEHQQASSCELASSSPTPPNQPSSDQESKQSPGAGEWQRNEEDFFAIDKIDYFPATKHLLVAGALSQVILFRLNKKEQHQQQSHEITTILVEPSQNSGFSGKNEQTPSQQSRQHLLLKAKSLSSTAGSSAGSGSTSSTGSHRSRSNGLQAEIICLTPLLVSNVAPDSELGTHSSSLSSATSVAHYCQAPPKVTALALQASHSILCYAHENGIVLVDTVQKCVILNATLADLYGSAPSSSNNRDISIQPFATSSILQHHYQSTGLPISSTTNNSALGGELSNRTNCNNSPTADNETSVQSKLIQKLRGSGEPEVHDNSTNDNAGLLRKSPPLNEQAAATASQFANSQSMSSRASREQQQSRFTSSMFQRQLSTNALNSSPAATKLASGPTRLFQRQMTASQLFSSTSQEASRQRLPQVSSSSKAAGELAIASSVSSLASPGGPSPPTRVTRRPDGSSVDEAQAAKKSSKNKRIISRMLSISAIHTTVGSSANSTDASWSQNNASDAQPADCPATLTNFGDLVSDKIDSSFTRSRSSSGSSTPHDNGSSIHWATGSETIQCLCLLDWSQASQPPSSHSNPPSSSSSNNNNKSLSSIDIAPAGQLALWAGTSQGSVLLVSLSMPDNEDNRVLQLQSVLAEPIPQASIRLPGSILCLNAFISETSRSGAGSHASQSTSQDAETEFSPSSVLRSQESSANSSFDYRSSTFLAVVSEKQARIYQVPIAGSSLVDHHHHQHHHQHQHQHQHQHHSHLKPTSQESAQPDPALVKLLISKANCVARTELSETTCARRSALVQMRNPDECCLVSYMANGNILALSLPQLRHLMEADFVPYSSSRLASSLCLSRNGHGLYQPSSSELAKFTISAQYRALINDMTGTPYVPREMPEMPRANFFKTLFAGASSAASKHSDRDELFSECSSGKPSWGVAKHVPSASGLDKLKGAAVGTMGHDLRQAREGLDERGEKLSEIEDRTLMMMNQSESYAQSAHQLAQKFKDKKWYQF